MKIDYYKPNLPEKELYQHYLDEIWTCKWLTNNGKYVQLLEKKLATYLNVDEVVLVANGTIGLQIALQSIGKAQRVLTSPFSFIASTSAIVWEKSDPVYSDINKHSLHIDIHNVPTTGIDAILPVQIFGTPIPESYSDSVVPVVVDGAHSFGVFKNGRSILSQGDISMVSLHATKYFHTVEGGALIVNNKKYAEKVKALRNFGFNQQQNNVEFIGINAKLSELHAAMGLSLFDNIDEFKRKHKKIYTEYQLALNKVSDVYYLPNIDVQLDYHYVYFPMVFLDNRVFQKFLQYLETMEIGYKRYFNIPLNKLAFVKNTSCPNAEFVCDNIVSLPIYASMTEQEINYVCEALKGFSV